MTSFYNFKNLHPISSYIRGPYALILLNLSNSIRRIVRKLCLEHNVLDRNGLEAVVGESLTLGKVNPIVVEKSNGKNLAFDPNEYYFILMIEFPHKYVFTIREYWDLYKAIDSNTNTNIYEVGIKSLLVKISIYDVSRNNAEASLVLDNISSDSGLMALPVPSSYRLLDEQAAWLNDYDLVEGSEGNMSRKNYVLQTSYLYRSRDKYTLITTVVIVSNNLADAYMGVYDSRELADVLMLAGPRVLELKFEDSSMRRVDIVSLTDFLHRILGGLYKTRRILL